MTYENAYEMLCRVRRGINEYTPAYAQGTDTTGAYTNEEISRQINDSQKYFFDLLVNRCPQVFYKDVILTPSSGVFTPPSDFYRLRRLENMDKREMFEITVDERQVDVEMGSNRHFYWEGGRLVVDNPSFPDQCRMFYVARPREIHSGVASAGGAASVTLISPAKKVADYYNGLLIEDVTSDVVDTISDYSSSRVATVTNTWAASRVYGLVSELPEAFHTFIGRRAILTMKATYKSLDKPSVVDLTLFREDLNETLKSLLGTFNTNQDIAGLFR